MLISLYCFWQTFDGDVDAMHHNKQFWKEDLKANVLKCFDIAIPDFAKQRKEIVDEVFKIMNTDWEYDSGFLSMKKFKQHCRAILKRERARLHEYWVKQCKEDRTKPGPMDLDPRKWSELVDYFLSPDSLAKSARMKKARSCVVDVSKYGRGGIVAAKKYHVSFFIMKCALYFKMKLNFDCNLILNVFC